MVLGIAPLPTTLGAVVTGVRLADLDDDTWREVDAAFAEHAVLVFPGQHLDDDEQVAFARRFGDIEDVGAGDIATITNRDHHGEPFADDHAVTMLLRGNEGWHTDSSYMPVSAKASMLSAHVVPSEGGQTQWADLRAAYDALPDDLRARVDTLSAHHSIAYAQAKLGQRDQPSNLYGFGGGPVPLRPLVKVHPVTGRRALFLGRHAHAIPGLDDEESEALLAELVAFTCQAPRVYTHDWEVGDLVVWDNRCVLHRAVPWSDTDVRVMKHTRVQGDPRTETAPTLVDA